MTRWSTAAVAAFLLSIVSPGTRADDVRQEVPRRVRVRHDTIMRWAPRYRLTALEEPVGPDRRFWERVDELPLYERLSLDARNLAHGHVDVAIAAWGALDLTVDTEGGIAAGDVAIAHVTGRYGPVALWAGRRFVPWGPPGGLHIDGVGGEVRSTTGIVGEVMVGRPVTPVYRASLGPRGSFQGPALAYGARVGYATPGELSASVSYMERWVDGLVERNVSLDGRMAAMRALDLSGHVIFDTRVMTVEQARVRIDWQTTDDVLLDLSYSHVNPQLLLPMGSILSVFATSTYDEGALGATMRLGGRTAISAELAARHHLEPASNITVPSWGYRTDAAFRWAPLRGPRLRLSVSHRDNGELGYTLFHAVGTLPVHEKATLALESGVGVDDRGERTAAYGRTRADVTLAREWTVGCMVDLARTPIARAELRSLVRVTWARDTGRRQP